MAVRWVVTSSCNKLQNSITAIRNQHQRWLQHQSATLLGTPFYSEVEDAATSEVIFLLVTCDYLGFLFSEVVYRVASNWRMFLLSGLLSFNPPELVLMWWKSQWIRSTSRNLKVTPVVFHPSVWSSLSTSASRYHYFNLPINGSELPPYDYLTKKLYTIQSRWWPM